jgi:hypothetical protein
MEFIYILREREFVNTNVNIYKIGRTSNWLKRYKQYPKNSELLFVQLVNNSKEIESEIIKILKEKTNQRRDIGREYFESNHNHIIKEVITICMKYIDTSSSIIKENNIPIIPIEVEESVTKCDDVKEFVNKCIIHVEIGKNIHVPFRDVYNSYIKFCESQKYIPSITDRKFKLAMSKYNIKTLRNNGTTFINIKLNN